MAPVAFAGGQNHPGNMPDLLPPNPTSGECYARVEVPAQYTTGSERVIVEEAVNRVEIYQAQLAERQEQVLIKEASTRYKVRQPSYSSVSEQMLVRPAYDKLSVSAPQYSTITETVQTSAPRLVWKRGNPAQLRSEGYVIHSTANGGHYGQGYSSTTSSSAILSDCGSSCEIWCLVEEPGQSTQFNRKVITSAGQVIRTPVPAKYKTVHKQVVSDPGGVEEIYVPAEYKSVTVEDIISPGGETVTTLPPKYADVATKTLIAPATFEWRRVLCKPGTGSINSGASYDDHASTRYGTESYSAGSYNTGTAYGHTVHDGGIVYGDTVSQSYGTTTPYYGAQSSSSHSNTDRKILGGFIGATAGGVLGSEIAGSGNRFEGAAIGAAIGGVTGAVIGGSTGNNETGYYDSSEYGSGIDYAEPSSYENIYESGHGAARKRKRW